MTLLFFLRSSNGSVAPAPGSWDIDDTIYEKKRKRKRLGKFATVEEIALDKVLKRREEEDLLLLFMHNIEDHEN